MGKKLVNEYEIHKGERDKKKSLKTKIAVPVILLVSIAVLVLGSAASYLCYRSTINTLSASMSSAVSIAQESVSNKLHTYAVLVDEAAENKIVYSPDVSVEEKIAFLAEETEEYDFINAYILDASGKDINSGTDFSGTDYFKASITGSVFFTSPYIDKDSGELVITLSNPIRAAGTEDSDITGVLCFTMPQSIINTIVEDLRISEHGAAYIIDKDGYTIADPDVQLVKDKENIEEQAKTNPTSKTLAALHSKARTGVSGIGTYTYKGVNKYLAFAPITGTDGWTICILAPQKDFISGVQLTIYVSAAIMLIAFLIALFGSLYIAKRVVEPVNIFVNRLTKLADGDVATPFTDFTATTSEFYVFKDALETVLINLDLLIKDIDYLLTEISSGNLDIFSRETDKYIGDYRHILTAFRRLKKNLTFSLQNVASVADQVTAGSSQVSSGAQTLAQGATEQASSIEELSASITEVAQHVMANAEDAAKASALTNDAKGIMSGSFEEMKQARQAMDEISATSKNISKVIKAIDDIAFQTNILALNAAVEAARAGSAGKGFAVVADEVRNLSQKSAEAAKNTTALIESSILAVEKGSALVNKTSEDFALVAEKATESSALVEDIAAKAQQQAAAIAQIKVGIDQVSSVVQMNSATSEESAAASEELSSQAAVLKGLVDQFKLATSFASDD